MEDSPGSISRATVQRMLGRFQLDTPRLARRKPCPPDRLLREIPMGRLSWDIDLPGSFEADLVRHCGESASGEYVHTLQLIDIATGWSERVAILGRSQARVVKGFKRVMERLPFPVRHSSGQWKRITSIITLNALNSLYDQLWLYYNPGS